MRVGLARGWWMTLWPVPVPASDGRYDCLLPGSVLLLLRSGARSAGPGAAAVWERRRCGGRGGWLLLELRASSFLAPVGGWRGRAVRVEDRPVFLPRGRALRALADALGAMAPALGLRPGGSVVRSALARFPPGGPGALAVALAVMES